MQTFNVEKAPEAIGPYSHAVKSGKFLYISGQIPLDPETMQLVEGGIFEQTHQVCNNVVNILNDLGYYSTNIIKNTIYLANMDDFATVNEIYGQYFAHHPARSAIQVGALPKGALVEIEAIAEVE